MGAFSLTMGKGQQPALVAAAHLHQKSAVVLVSLGKTRQPPGQQREQVPQLRTTDLGTGCKAATPRGADEALNVPVGLFGKNVRY